ncbi:SDR family NAD(P)-dependent oxidoreductase [Streptomyces sp. MZ04]|nr:SDR family NAD(P)-dependent oxidoreductase [Streptomyces sp. MZ04]
MTTARQQQDKLGSGFDASSTADDVLDGIDLHGRTALVTGGYSGLGLEITRALSRAGAHVIVPARRPATAREALRDIPGVEVRALDLADLASIRKFADHFLTTDDRKLDILINNAGVMACPETRMGPDGAWEAHFAINHLGHFALTNRLAPALSSRNARVVSVSGLGEHRYSGWR